MTAFQQFLKRQGLTSCALAKRVGLSKSQVGEYAREVHLPSRRTLQRIAVALRVPLGDLLLELPHREKFQNHPYPAIYCRLCRRKLYKMPTNPEQFDRAPVADTAALAA